MKFLLWFQVATCLNTSPAHTGTAESGRNGAESRTFGSGNKIESESFRVGNKLKIKNINKCIETEWKINVFSAPILVMKEGRLF